MTVTPYPDNDKNKNVDKVELSYTNNGAKKTVTLTRNPQNGTWTSSGDGADGIQINGNSFSLKAGSVQVGTEVKAKSYFGNSDASDERTERIRQRTATPTVTANQDGSVTVTPNGNANSLTVKYIEESNSQKTEITANKQGSTWTVTGGTNVTIDQSRGIVTIPANSVKDRSEVEAQAKATDEFVSATATATAKDQDRTAPTIRVRKNGTNTWLTPDSTGKVVVVATPERNNVELDVDIKDEANGSGYEFSSNGTNPTATKTVENSTDYNENSTTYSAYGKAADATAKLTVGLKAGKTTTDFSGITMKLNAKDKAGNATNATNKKEVTVKIVSAKPTYPPRVKVLNPTNIKETEKDTILKAIKEANKTNEANPTFTKESDGIKATYTDGTTYKVPYSEIVTYNYVATKKTINVGENPNWGSPKQYFTYEDGGAIGDDKTFLWKGSSTPMTAPNNPDLTVGTNKRVEVLAPNPEGGNPKTLTLTYDVVDNQPPKVKINGVELGENVDQNPRFVIYRGAEFNPTFEVEDNSGKTTYLKASDIPSGVWFNKQQNGHDVEKTDMANNAQYTLTTNNIVDNNNTLGEHTASVTVKDASRNEKTYQFKYVIVDIEARNTPETVPLNTKLVDPADKDHAKDSQNYVKVSDGNAQKPNGDDDYYTTGMSFTWSKNNTPITNKTLLSTPGVVEYTAVVTFPNNGATYSKTVDGKTVTVYPPKKDTVSVTFKVKPTAPTVTPATNGDVTVTPANEINVNKVEVTYTPADTNRLEDNGTVTKTAQDRTTVIATKGSNNQWSITSGAKEGISVNTTTGEITLKDQVVKDRTKIQAKVVAQEVPSDENGNSDSKDGDRTNPTIGLGNTLVGVGKEINLSLGLSDNGVGIDDSNIKVTLPAGASGLRYDARTKSITGTLGSIGKHEVKVTVLDKNGNKAEKTISIAAVKPKPIYEIKDGTINNVDTPSHFVEVPAGVTNPSVAWKNGKPTTTTVGTTNKAVTVSATGYTSTEVDVPVKVYDKVTLKASTYTNAKGTLANGKNANDYVNGIGQGVTVKWKNDQVPDVSQANPNLKGYIEVSYATDDAEHPIKDTLEVSLPTYSATLTHTSYETTVGTEFGNFDANRGGYFTHDYPVTGDSKVKGFWSSKNYLDAGRDKKANTIGSVVDTIGVYFPNADKGIDYNENRKQLLPVTFNVKPQAPTINADDFRGKAGTKPPVTVGNLPTAGQLGTDARVTVELYQGTNKVASKVVSKGTNSVSFNSGDYTANLIAGQEVHAVVKVEGTTDKKAYDLSSANSSTARVTTTAPEKPKISQNPEDLVVNATVGQGNSTNATLTYHDANNQAQNVEFTKTGNSWTKSNNNNTNITITTAGVIELKAGVAKEGTSVSVKQRTETSEYSEPATEKVLGRLNGLTNTPKADGSVEIMVPPTATHMTLTYTPQGQTTPKTLEYTKTGTTWTTHTETNTYSNDHKIVIPKENVADGTKVSVIASNDNSTTTTVISKAKFEQPNATTSNQRDNGDVRITLPDNADTVTVTYKDAQNATKSVTLTKGAGNQWTSGGNLPNGVTLANNVVEISYKTIKSDENTVRTASTRGEEDVRSQEATQEITADHRPPTTQAVVIAAGATPTNEDLSRGVTVDKRSVTAKSPLAAIAAGTITEVPATLTYNDGSTEDITLTVKSKPTAPTFNNLENHGTFSGLSSASKEISGTAMAGAEKVKLTLQDGSVKEIIPNADGSWSYTLGATEYLTQNFSGVNNRVFDEHTVKAVQVKNGIESEAATANVAPGQATIDDVYKAGRAITVNIPHDVEAGYVRVNGTDYGIQKVDGTWKVISSASNATKLEISSAVVDPNNKAVTKVTFSVKNNNDALYNPPFRIGDTPVKFRTHYSKNGNIGVPTPGIQGTDGWNESPTPKNTKPTVNFVAGKTIENGKVFTSPTVDELKDYFEGHDAEDDANLTVGYPASANGKLRVQVFTQDTNQPVSANAQNRIAAGNYRLVLSTIDAAGVESDSITRNITVKTMADFYRNQVLYPVNTDKVVYNDSDINNGNFTDAAKDRFKGKVEEVNANNRNLPTGVTYTKGNTDDKTKVVGVNFPDGSTIDISHTLVAKPTVPTFNATSGDEHEHKLQDVDRVVSGTALQSATKVILELQTGKKIEILANDEKDPATLQPGEGVLKNGVWTYKLENNMYLRQTEQTAEIGSSPLPVKVKQVVFEAESDESQIYVAKERNFTGKTFKEVKGSSVLTELKNHPENGINYTEKGKTMPFPGDFTASWERVPDVETVGTRTYKVQLTEKGKSDARPGEYTVTITVVNPAPAKLTYENKNNGTTRIKLPDDADKVVFTLPGDQRTKEITLTSANSWELPANSGIEKEGNYLVVKSSNISGNRRITAVATKGDGELKSAETPTSITVPEHTVTTEKIRKVKGTALTNTDLLGAVEVDDKKSAKLKVGTTAPETVGLHEVNVTVTYNDDSTEDVKVAYEIIENTVEVPTSGITGDYTKPKANIAGKQIGEETTYTPTEITTTDGKVWKPKKDGNITFKVGETPETVEYVAKFVSDKGAPAIEFRVKLPLPLVVPDPEHLTPTEIAELVKRVKEANNDEANPDKEVTVDDKGNVTVTDKNTGESALLPVEDLTVKDFTPVKPSEKVPAKDILHLTPEEKKQVEDKVKAKNPGKEVTVGEDGTATVKDPTTGVSHIIPGSDLTITVGNDATENNRPEDVRPDQVPATPEVPDNNGQDTPAVTPSNDDTANNSDAITPSDDVADTENTQARPHRSQAILPNTGTAESAGFLSAAASMIAGLGFLIPFGKRRKKEEEESQND